MLTGQKLCAPNPGAGRMRLGRQLAGIAIGMSEGEVIGALGQASRVDDAKEREAGSPFIANTRYSAKYGERILVYDSPDDLKFAFVFLRSGRVRTIWYAYTE